jgi:hypothetical protein
MSGKALREKLRRGRIQGTGVVGPTISFGYNGLYGNGTSGRFTQ